MTFSFSIYNNLGIKKSWFIGFRLTISTLRYEVYVFRVSGHGRFSKGIFSLNVFFLASTLCEKHYI